MMEEFKKQLIELFQNYGNQEIGNRLSVYSVNGLMMAMDQIIRKYKIEVIKDGKPDETTDR